jgi:predicted SAM-dependent methyltransferase
MIHREECAICSGELASLYVIDNMPIKLCCVDSVEGECFPISFSRCRICNTIQLDRLIPLDVLYSSSHNTVSVGKTWENYFRMFCDKVGEIVEDAVVLEIGDPSGRVACALSNYDVWYIVEPNKNESVQWKENIHFIEDFFDENFSLGFSVDRIVHSHVFEHIYSPNVFLKKCWNVLKEEGEMFFGIPNMEYIAKYNLAPCLGVFFEHTIFLSKENIKYLLNRNGFEIVSIYDYENHSILFHVKKVMPAFIDVVSITDYTPVFLNSIENWKAMIRSVDDSIELYIFGASYNSQYILALGLANKKIMGILDNCKEKQGKYLYGYPLKIFSPSVICGKVCGVIVKNGYYSNEILSQLRELNSDVIIINENI